jgi:hypothetical protein
MMNRIARRSVIAALAAAAALGATVLSTGTAQAVQATWTCQPATIFAVGQVTGLHCSGLSTGGEGGIAVGFIYNSGSVQPLARCTRWTWQSEEPSDPQFSVGGTGCVNPTTNQPVQPISVS